MSVTQITIARRRGFTLVELLVVIAIIGVLMGLLMPAIMNARLSALQATCANNERELAHAMILFDSDKGRLPYVGRTDNNYSWYAQILEELGQGKQVDWLADNPKPNENNIPPIKQFKCPVGDAAATGSSYIANAGSTSNSSDQKYLRSSGLLYYYSGKGSIKTSISDIHDGASTTILVSEMVTKVPGNGASSYGTPPNWLYCNNDESYAKQHFGLRWDGSRTSPNTDKNGIAYPNFPTSRHSQINNVAFADGSVKVLSKSIYYSTYVSLMCPNDSGANVTANIGGDPSFQQ